ncbi:KxYKxGKxW signal peptide domain-containing protein [Limosilactobacillus sp.]|uniref:KxYKxGKxW signal peptide domain-containing protein n=1 Tax=Limosilactobacillus sp. TaxID=2773925 RepID=UPI003EFFD0DA
MESKKHFKMYKSGKLWVTAAVLGLSVMTGMTVNNQQVKADDQAPVVANTVTQNAATSQNNAETPSNNNNQGNTNQQPTTPADSQGNQQAAPTSETFTRQINYTNADGSDPSSASQTTKVTKTADGSYNTTGASWSGATLPTRAGMYATLNGKEIHELPTDVTLTNNGQPDTSALKVIFVQDALSPKQNPTDAEINSHSDMYRTITRTINITDPTSGKLTKVEQKVIYGRTKTQQTNGNFTYGDWESVHESNPSPLKPYEIQKDGYVAKTGEDNYVTAVPSLTNEEIAAAQNSDNGNTNLTVNVTYVKAQSTITPDPTKKDQQTDLWKKVTRTINYQLAVGEKEPTVQEVWFKRSNTAVIDNSGKVTNHYTNWEPDGDASWPYFQIDQLPYYHTLVDGQRQVSLPFTPVTDTTADQTYTVTYVSDGTDPYNQQVVPGLRGNWASIDAIHMTDTGIHVTGWNANSDSYNRNYHFLIILDYGQNPVVGQFHEVGRKLVAGGVNRPDVFKVHPVWNAATSGFDDTVNLDLSKIKAGDKLRILSRWTADPNGNNDPADLVSSYYTMDYGTNVANLDGMAVTSDGQQLEVDGWNATNQVVGRKYHYIILLDSTTGREIGRQLVTDGIDRPDVSAAYPNLLNASKSGFKVRFNLAGIDLGHNLQVVSRYSDTLGGEGSNVDYWFPARRLINGTTANFSNLDGVNADAKSGKVTFSGWNATNYSQVEPNHYLILFDSTANKQVDAIKLDSKNGLVSRPDVQRAFSNVNGALNSGFNYSIDMSKLTYGHTYALVSRYSSSADGNGGNGAYTDHWFNNAFTFNQQAYSIDSLGFATKAKASASDQAATDGQNNQVTIDQNKLHVTGWMASDAAVNYKYAYVIVLDAKGGELGRSQVTLQDRNDVLKAFPTIYNAGKSGFDTEITLDDQAAKKAQDDGIQLVLRYTNDKGGNGKVTVDQWTPSYKYNQADNRFVQA